MCSPPRTRDGNYTSNDRPASLFYVKSGSRNTKKYIYLLNLLWIFFFVLVIFKEKKNFDFGFAAIKF